MAGENLKKTTTFATILIKLKISYDGIFKANRIILYSSHILVKYFFGPTSASSQNNITMETPRIEGADIDIGLFPIFTKIMP